VAVAGPGGMGEMDETAVAPAVAEQVGALIGN
jgi:hypothetical protein